MKTRYYLLFGIAALILGYVGYLHVPSISGGDLFVLLIGIIGSAALGAFIFFAYQEHTGGMGE